MTKSIEEIEQRTKVLHELKAIRYTVGVILVNLLSLSENTIRFEDGLVRKIVKLLQREEERTRKETNEKEKVSHTLLKEKEKKEKKKKEEEKLDIRNLEFNSFTLSNSYFNSLVSEYGVNVVTDSCVVLDKLISLNGRTYKDVKKKLRELCDNFSMRDKLVEDYSYTSQRVRSVNYKAIENIEDARSYIINTPFYMRNVEQGVLYLQEKFPELKEIKCS